MASFSAGPLQTPPAWPIVNMPKRSCVCLCTAEAITSIALVAHDRRVPQTRAQREEQANQRHVQPAKTRVAGVGPNPLYFSSVFTVEGTAVGAPLSSAAPSTYLELQDRSRSASLDT